MRAVTACAPEHHRGRLLPPSDGARLGRITFDDWLPDSAV